jgi:hypothetical protein
MEKEEQTKCDCNLCKENKFWKDLFIKYNFTEEEKEFIENIRLQKENVLMDNIFLEEFFNFRSKDKIITFLEDKLKHIKNN